MSLLPYKESISANNVISKTSISFTLGGDALELTYNIFEPGRYKITVVYQYRHEEKYVLHSSRLMVDFGSGDVEVLGIDTDECMGGDQGQGTEKFRITADVKINLPIGSVDFSLQYASGENGKIATIIYREISVERYD